MEEYQQPGDNDYHNRQPGKRTTVGLSPGGPGLRAGQLGRILQAEGVAYQEAALSLLARAAEGSMRDALSLLDQAISFTAGRVDEDPVRAMLGTISRDLTFDLLRALAAADGAARDDDADDDGSKPQPLRYCSTSS